MAQLGSIEIDREPALSNSCEDYGTDEIVRYAEAIMDLLRPSDGPVPCATSPDGSVRRRELGRQRRHGRDQYSLSASESTSTQIRSPSTWPVRDRRPTVA